MTTQQNTLPLSLYIHIPWCLQKCPYCDFNSHTQRTTTLDEDAYIKALIHDFKYEWRQVEPQRSISTIFIGGGTPSLFSENAIDQLLSAIAQYGRVSSTAEITLEANPGTFEQSRFSGYRQAGVNRLSIGIQSFDDKILKQLGRVHSADEARKSGDIARRAGFDNFNIDLMFGLPGQSLESARDDIAQGLAIASTHFSYYQLTIEPNTAFHAQPPVLPDDEQCWDIQAQGQMMLAEAGFQQYEVSAYAQPDKQCQHNLNYWQFGDYLGIGAGAHGKLTHQATKTITRRWKTKQPKQYLNSIFLDGAIGGENVLEKSEYPFEFMMNALRLKHGFALPLYEQHTGDSSNSLKLQIEAARTAGLITNDNNHIKPTKLGWQHLNALILQFLA